MNTEIYGTFGPSCKSKEVLEEMIQHGLTGMRLNLSHATLEQSREYIINYREAAKNKEVVPQILMDMQGPELRIGDMEEARLEVGSNVFLVEADSHVQGQKGDEIRILVPPPVLTALSAGMELLLDDGKMRMKIEQAKEHYAMASVLVGGVIKPHKSIKIVDVNVQMPVLTKHDIENLRKAKEYGVTALMQPFVFSGKDLEKVKKVLKEEGIEELKVFAKIENKMGIKHLESILPYADMIVIARGDLGNDMPLWELPGAQKRIENICKSYGKPYMVVTQMLASMENNPVPTRAEVSDVFHAVYHGANAVMVTGETAVGKYPQEVIKYLTNTSRQAEEMREKES